MAALNTLGHVHTPFRLPGLPFETGAWTKTQSDPMKSMTYYLHFLVFVLRCLKSSHRQLSKDPNFAEFEVRTALEAAEKRPRLTPKLTKSPIAHHSSLTERS